MLLHVLEHLFGNGREGLEHALAGHGDRLVKGDHARVQCGIQFFDGQHIGQVALVVLKHHGKIRQIDAHIGKIVPQIGEAFEVRIEHGTLRVSNKDDAVSALQHQFARGVIEHLTRHRVEMEPHLVVLDRTKLNRKEVEEERPVGFRGKRDELAALRRRDAVIDHVDVRGLAAEARPVIHDLCVDFSDGVVN